MITNQLLRQASNHHRSGRFHEAEIIYREILAAEPDNAHVWQLLGMIAHEASDMHAAVRCIRHAIALMPTNAEFHNNLGIVFGERDKYHDALTCLSEAIRLRPEYALAHNNVGEMLKQLGRLKEAIASYESAVRIDPNLSAARSNLLMALNYAPDVDRDTLFAAHLRWGELMESRVPPQPGPAIDLDPDRPLRVGYVSPDFRKHAVARFFAPILAGHDANQFAIYLYDASNSQDAVTEWMREQADGWRNIWNLEAARAASLIREDRIDILVDLAGHTRRNRLDVFAYRPAPVQATFLGYPNTTGLRTMDYRISDNIIDPPGGPTWCSEEVMRLPGGISCFAPPQAPDVVPPPVLTSGVITFGSYHPPIRLNDQLFACWRRILDAVPGSRLLLMRSTLTPEVAAELDQRLLRQGIAPDRVVMRRPSVKDYLDLFGDIDIVLDSSPGNGHTMTCEALWMGVPVVTLYGDRPVGRLSASVLTALGLTEMIAATTDDYVEKSAGLARAIHTLVRLRRELRSRVQASLCDGASFTRRLEDVYQGMWRKACRTSVKRTNSSTTSPVEIHRSGSQRRDFGNPDLPNGDASERGDHAARPTHELAGLGRGLRATIRDGSDAWRALGLLASETGHHRIAEECLLNASKLGTNHTWSEQNLGAMWDLAVPTTTTADRVAADDLESLNRRGMNLARHGQLEAAKSLFDEAIRLRPHHPSAHNNLAIILQRLGCLDEAERAVVQAIRLSPAESTQHANLGLILQQQGRLDEALISLRNALRFSPGNLDASLLMAAVLRDLGRAREAIAPLRMAASIEPQSALTHNRLGCALRECNQAREALASFRRALQVDPNFIDAHANIGGLLDDQGETEEARRWYHDAYRLQPSSRLKVLYELSTPVIYRSEEHVYETRQRLTEGVERIHAEGIRLDPSQELLPTHFYLAYQGMNDRDLHAAIARLADGPRGVDIRPVPAPRGGKIRIGFLSRFLRNHTIGQLNQGLIARLSREDFEVVLLSTGPHEDGLARRIRESADRYVAVPSSLRSALKVIAEQGLHVLYFPDIGMDLLTYTLAFSRLAPVQAVTWGHPVTTGLPTMDYFLSSIDLETDASAEHYTEQLVRLPRLGVYYDRPKLPVVPKNRADFGLPDRANVYICPQSLFKFHPTFDKLLAGILRSDPNGLLVLVEGRYPRWNELLKCRFARSMVDVQSRVRFLPQMPRADFWSLLAISDVMLDTTHFGGGNSSYEGLAFGVPIVTLPTEFLRCRLTYAMYRQMGLPDLIASDAEDYIRKAVQLGTDADYRAWMQNRIHERSDVLYEDLGAVRAVEQFLIEAVSRTA